MPGEAAEFFIALGDNVSPNAIKIAESIERMSAAQIKGAKAALALDAANSRAQSLAAKAALDQAKAADALKKHGEASQEAGGAAKALSESLEELGGSATHVDGSIGKVQKILSKLGPEGLAVAAALGVLTIAVTATVGTMLELAKTAIEVNEGIDLFSSRLEALTGSAKGGDAVLDMVRELGSELPFATKQIGEWAESLTRAGLRGKELEAATRAIAAAAAINPKGGAEAASEFFAKLGKAGKESAGLVQAVVEQSKKGTGPLREMGIELADLGGEAAVATMKATDLSKALAAALSQKGQGPLEAMANSWPVILQKAKEGFLSLFARLGKPVSEFMGAVKALFGEFNRGRPLMNGLQSVATSVFSTLFDWGTRAVNAIHKGFLMVGIAALTAYIAMRPAINAIKEFVTSANFLRGVKVLLAALAIALVPFIVSIGAVVAAIGLFIAIQGILASVTAAVAGAILYAVGVVVGFAASIADAFMGAYNAATAAGGNFVDGLIAGIGAGASRVVSAVKGLANSALDAFKRVLGIASPSKVMLEHGEENIAGATATGIDRGAGKVDAAMARLGSGDKGGARATVTSAGGEKHYHFHYEGGSVGEYEKFREYIERFMEETDAEAPAFT